MSRTVPRITISMAITGDGYSWFSDNPLSIIVKVINVWYFKVQTRTKKQQLRVNRPRFKSPYTQKLQIKISHNRVCQQKPNTQNFNSKESFKKHVWNSLIIHFKMCSFLILFWSWYSCCWSMSKDLTTFQLLVLFDEHFYIASGFCWHTL